MNVQSDRSVTEKTRIVGGGFSLIMENIIREIREQKDTIDLGRLRFYFAVFTITTTEDDRIQHLMQEIQQFIKEKFGENEVPYRKPIEEIPEGNYGQLINTTNNSPISFDVSFNSVNDTNKINEATEDMDAIMKDDSDVAICSTGEASDNSDNETKKNLKIRENADGQANQN
ncbi:hypothetical protein AVEN_79631-1 [Araneus ventricosus]|uniref:Uncharacterized protein n=1 Tax=Araneus ventricosus TaxID=182803 RepID=A0A4Y2G2C8_ARAVE|nr:hypothetical protein AVEN_79631-1 [Araneus ventricosus]